MVCGFDRNSLELYTVYKGWMWGGIFVCLQSSLFFWFTLSSLLCFHLHESAYVCVCFMGMRATESLQKKHICLRVIRWIIVLLLSVRESSLPCPPKVWVGIKASWQLQNSGCWMWEQALPLWAEISPPFLLSWGLRQVWRPVVSPLHSTGCCSPKLACYNLLRQWGTVTHHFRINGCRWKLGCGAFSPCSNKPLIDFIIIILTAQAQKET